jgi:hypothetical protein
MDMVNGIVGTAIEKATVRPQVIALLKESECTVTHFETVINTP